MNNKDEECDEIPRKDGKWKESCAAIFGLTVSVHAKYFLCCSIIYHLCF